MAVWGGEEGWGMSLETTGMGQILLSYVDFGFHHTDMRGRWRFFPLMDLILMGVFLSDPQEFLSISGNSDLPSNASPALLLEGYVH